jgi:hypothetical protein
VQWGCHWGQLLFALQTAAGASRSYKIVIIIIVYLAFVGDLVSLETLSLCKSLWQEATTLMMLDH